ncbi:MAG TPA: VOC family protein [Dehalococcoidia bacterium]|nr:VOC family protein [Dehalococcoidia bacterium]
MIHTRGLAHIHFAVGDLQRSLHFYQQAFGMRELFRAGPDLVFLQSPGGSDTIALHADPGHKLEPGKSGGIAHFGFNLVGDEPLDDAVSEVEAAGGSLVSRGEHGPRSAYVYVADPDGYVIELMAG